MLTFNLYTFGFYTFLISNAEVYKSNSKCKKMNVIICTNITHTHIQIQYLVTQQKIIIIENYYFVEQENAINFVAVLGYLNTSNGKVTKNGVHFR